MRSTWMIATVLGVGLAVAGWSYRDAAPVSRALAAVGVSTGSTPLTVPTLQAAGVHKCVSTRGTSYLDGPCPVGSREVAANGGTMTVTSFPKPVPAPSSRASSVLGGPLIKPMDPDERDRLREAVEDAASRR